MEEKERYYSLIDHNGNFTLRDYETGNELTNLFDLDDLLNQQDKRIKELEKENGYVLFEDGYDKDGNEIHKQVYITYKEAFTRLVLENKKLRKENQQLKQQIHDLPKKIVEYFYDEIRHRAILEVDYCLYHNLEKKYGVRKCLLENIRTTILKKYGGENK